MGKRKGRCSATLQPAGTSTKAPTRVCWKGDHQNQHKLRIPVFGGAGNPKRHFDRSAQHRQYPGVLPVPGPTTPLPTPCSPRKRPGSPAPGPDTERCPRGIVGVRHQGNQTPAPGHRIIYRGDHWDRVPGNQIFSETLEKNPSARPPEITRSHCIIAGVGRWRASSRNQVLLFSSATGMGCKREISLVSSMAREEDSISDRENGNRFLERLFTTVPTPAAQHSGGGKYLSMCAKLPFASDRLPLLPSDSTKNTLWPSPHGVSQFMLTARRN